MNRQEKRAAAAKAKKEDRAALKRANEKMKAAIQKRLCGPCDACCTLLEVSELDKPEGKPCELLSDAGGGCSAYADRPKGCRNWECSWRMGLGREEDRPDKSGIVFDVTRKHARFPALVAREVEPGQSFQSESGFELLGRMVQDGHMIILLMENGGRRVIGPEAKLKEIRELADEQKAQMEMGALQ